MRRGLALVLCLLLSACGEAGPDEPEFGADSPEGVIDRLAVTDRGFADIIRMSVPDERPLVGMTFALLPLIVAPIALAMSQDLEDQEKQDLARELTELLERHQLKDMKSMPDRREFEGLPPEEQLERATEAIPDVDWVRFADEAWALVQRIRARVGTSQEPFGTIHLFHPDRETLEVDGARATVRDEDGKTWVLVERDRRWYLSLLETNALEVASTEDGSD